MSGSAVVAAGIDVIAGPVRLASVGLTWLAAGVIDGGDGIVLLVKDSVVVAMLAVGLGGTFPVWCWKNSKYHSNEQFVL